MNKVLLLIGIIGICFLQLITAEDDTCLLVKTTEGTYKGKTFPTGARAFLGIPFAIPPLGKLRWRRALWPKSFRGVREAIESGPCCPQTGIFKNLTVAESEDCLTLDVYTPLNARPGDKLPVKVYIHGGGFAANSAALVPGDQLAVNSSSVVVIINYRLSYQGFMVFTPLLEEDKGIVNYGITDQQLALEWVQRNAREFGGDKDNVLIFGNSAGGMSVLMHYTLPSSKKLFKAGVAESPGPWDLITAQAAAKMNDPLAARLGCYNNVTKKVDINCLRQVNITTIYAAAWATSTPVYDNLIQRPIANTLADKKLMKKAKGGTPLMIGRTNVEGNQFAWLGLRLVTKNPQAPLWANYQMFFGIINSTFPFNSTTNEAIAAYYAKSAVNGNYFVPLSNALGDYGITCGTDRAAANALKGLNANVYNYYFTHATGQWRYTQLNATHTAEIPYVLMSNGTLMEAVFTPEEFQLSRQTVKYMGNFLDTFNPNLADKKNPALPIVDIINWPALKEAPSNTTLNWDTELSVLRNPVPLSCSLFWDNMLVDRPANRGFDVKSRVEKLINEAHEMERSLLSKKDITKANIPIKVPKIPRF